MVGDLPVIEFTGEVDLATLPRFRDSLVRALDAHTGSTVAADLDAVQVLDDAGLGILLGAAARARTRGGELVLICSGERIRFRLAASRLDLVIPVYATATEAAHTVVR
jgi:anti-anti-sigma factor